MNKDELIAEILILSPADQREILQLLRDRLENGVLNEEQEKALSKHLNKSAHVMPHVGAWAKVYERLSRPVRPIKKR